MHSPYKSMAGFNGASDEGQWLPKCMGARTFQITTIAWLYRGAGPESANAKHRNRERYWRLQPIVSVSGHR